MDWIYPAIEREKNESVVDYLLRSRGVSDPKLFLNPSLDDLSDFAAFHDSTMAAKVIAESIALGEQIYIHGDFDVDGVCATSILWDFLYRHAKAKVLPYIPSRFDQGYGLSESSITDMQSQGAQLIITVDCGVKDLELVQKYSDLKFVITDHHTLATDADGLPIVSEFAKAVVHPKHPTQAAPFPEVCGTTVAWKLIQAINAELGLGVDTNQYLDRVALATNCDVMPLVSENRIIVKHGLAKMRQTSNPGIKALLEVSGVEQSQIDTYHLGFVLGPRLNAAGRIEDAMIAVKLLTTTKYDQALNYARTLQDLNTHRQDLTADLLAQAEEQLSADLDSSLLFVHGVEWPEGIVGLVAGKLAEKYHRPVIVGSQNGDTIKASARSIAGFHLANALGEISDLLIRHGGHELAAGLTLHIDNLSKIKEILKDSAKQKLATKELKRKLNIDAVLESIEANTDTASEIAKLGPFGFGNAEPVIAIKNINLAKNRSFGSKQEHQSFVSSDLPGADIVCFNASPDLPTGKVDLAARISIREWRDRRYLQLRASDIVSSQ